MDGLYGQLMQNLGGQISQKVTSFVREEMREQQGVLHDSMVQMLRSGVATPGGAVLGQQQKVQSMMQEIKQALDKQDVNSAFRLALSASDLAAVLYVCEKVNVHEVNYDISKMLKGYLMCIFFIFAVIRATRCPSNSRPLLANPTTGS